MTKTLSIIGTAGRREDIKHLNSTTYYKMIDYARSYVIEKGVMQLKSGGAAWVDHIAVELFLEKVVSSLILCLPAPFENQKFYSKEFKDAGSCSNYYHQKFSQKTNKQSLNEIDVAIKLGAKVEVYENNSSRYGGFFARNSVVADCDLLLAFTFGESDVPKNGGTKDTWDKSSAKLKKHVSIRDL